MLNREKGNGKRSRKIFIPMAPDILRYIIGNLEVMEDFKCFMISANEKERKADLDKITRDTDGMSEQEIEEYGLSNIVRQYGEVPRQTAVEKQRESQLLLQLSW